MKQNFMGITRALALSGVTDFSFVEQDDLWRGSEVHRIIELSTRGTLDRKSVPKQLAGYLNAHDKFMAETGAVTLHIEAKVQDKTLSLRGRIDWAGLVKGKRAICDFKTGAIQWAVALQLCLGAHLLSPGEWFHRYAIQLKQDGNYAVKQFPLMSWPSDLCDALACVRVAQRKLKEGAKIL